MGELHLDIIVDRMNANSVLRLMSASRRSLIAKPFARLSSRKASLCVNRAVVGSMDMSYVEVGTKGPGEGYEFVNAIVGGVVPRENISARSTRVFSEQMENGVVAGYPVVDVEGHII